MQPLLSEGAGPTLATKRHDRAPEVARGPGPPHAGRSRSHWVRRQEPNKPGLDEPPGRLCVLEEQALGLLRNLIRDNLGQRAGRESLPTVAWALTPEAGAGPGWGPYLMGMSFMISRNMEGDTTRFTVAWQQGVRAFVHDLALQHPAVEGFPGGSMPVGQDSRSKSGFSQPAHGGNTGGRGMGTRGASKQGTAPATSGARSQAASPEEVF